MRTKEVITNSLQEQLEELENLGSLTRPAAEALSQQIRIRN